MPLYEYTCLDCNETFDVLRKFSEVDQGVRCLYCESENTARALSTFAVHGGTRTTTEPGPVQRTATNGGGCCSGGACGCAI